MKSDHPAGSRTAEDADVEETQVVQIPVIASSSERIWSRCIPGFSEGRDGPK